MSDHWNSIANLLKTPSLNPTTKKTDAPPKSTKTTAAVESVVRNEEPVAPPVESPKSKPEPSRLRSSWDAVATFFGVAAPEQPSEPEPKAIASSESSGVSKSSVGGKKSKPSMWGDIPDEPVSLPQIEKSAFQVEKPIQRFEEKAESPRESEFPRARSRGRDRGARSEESDRSEVSASEPTVKRSPVTDRSDDSRTVEPERRSQRQQPRRGRQADVRVDAVFGEPEFAQDAILDEPEVLEIENADRDETPRVDASRAPRGRGQREPRPERGPRQERAPRDDRPPRSQAEGRTERPARPPREDGFDRESSSDRPERQPRSEGARPARPEGQTRQARSENANTDRPSRPERVDRQPRADRPERAPRADVSDRGDRPARSEGVRGERSARTERPARGEAGDRPPRGERSERPSASRVERSNRDAPADRRPPTSSASKKSSGFGAGIHDDDSFAFVDEPIEAHDDFDFVVESSPSDTNEEIASEFGERETRPRRRRGRGRRSGSRTSESEASTDSLSIDEDRNEEDDDSSDFISKNSRIPSWQETIGTLVAVNMENHQRNQSQNRQPRGRGPRRDR
jgi:hypothetical protein